MTIPAASSALEAQFLSALPAIERVLEFVARRNRLSPDDAEEFGSLVKLKFIESEYEVLRKFEGRSSLQTYLSVVIQRLFLDYRIAAWGKWRPSAEAKRLGPLAVRLVSMSRTPYQQVRVMRQESVRRLHQPSH